jgi:hypothetical protein
VITSLPTYTTSLSGCLSLSPATFCRWEASCSTWSSSSSSPWVIYFILFYSYKSIDRECNSHLHTILVRPSVCRFINISCLDDVYYSPTASGVFPISTLGRQLRGSRPELNQDANLIRTAEFVMEAINLWMDKRHAGNSLKDDWNLRFSTNYRNFENNSIEADPVEMISFFFCCKKLWHHIFVHLLEDKTNSK